MKRERNLDFTLQEMCCSSGSIYEPLKLSILQRDDEPLWEKLDHYYGAGEFSPIHRSIVERAA